MDGTYTLTVSSLGSLDKVGRWQTLAKYHWPYLCKQPNFGMPSIFKSPFCEIYKAVGLTGSFPP